VLQVSADPLVVRARIGQSQAVPSSVVCPDGAAGLVVAPIANGRGLRAWRRRGVGKRPGPPRPVRGGVRPGGHPGATPGQGASGSIRRRAVNPTGPNGSGSPERRTRRVRIPGVQSERRGGMGAGAGAGRLSIHRTQGLRLCPKAMANGRSPPGREPVDPAPAGPRLAGRGFDPTVAGRREPTRSPHARPSRHAADEPDAPPMNRARPAVAVATITPSVLLAPRAAVVGPHRGRTTAARRPRTGRSGTVEGFRRICETLSLVSRGDEEGPRTRVGVRGRNRLNHDPRPSDQNGPAEQRRRSRVRRRSAGRLRKLGG